MALPNSLFVRKWKEKRDFFSYSELILYLCRRKQQTTYYYAEMADHIPDCPHRLVRHWADGSRKAKEVLRQLQEALEEVRPLAIR